MKYKEFEEKVKDWGRKYHYEPVIDVASTYIEIAFEDEYSMIRICTIHKSKRFIIDLTWSTYSNLSENARNDLFKIVTEFAKTPPEERKDEKRFIIPLPRLVTTDGKQQYLSYEYGNFFASRRDETLIQTWDEKHMKYVPDVYIQFAVEYDEEKEH